MMKSMDVLVVDNQPIILTYMESILTGNGCEVRLAKSGLEALDIMRDRVPDIIYVDLIMPNIDGTRLCRIIRSDPSNAGIFIVVLSAISAEVEVDFAAFGADACIAKGPFPVMKENVLEILDLIRNGERRSAEGMILGLEEVDKRVITEELLDTRKHFELILSRTSEGILELDADRRVVYANTRAASILGTDDISILGAPLARSLPGEAEGRFSELIRRLDGGEKTASSDGPLLIGETFVEADIVRADPAASTVLVILRDVTRRHEDGEEIRKALADREVLLREIHHRVKNNLAMIVSLINLQKSRVADAACRDSLEQLENRVRSISLVHDMLYLGGESARLDMRRYIEELCARVFESLTGGGPGIVLEIRIEHVIADLDISIPIGLIITELMTNAVKYAFPAGRGGTIAVSLAADVSRRYVLTVADDGVGMAPGSEGRNPDGLGLRLVRALADQIGGTVAVESAAGTRISVAFRGETR